MAFVMELSNLIVFTLRLTPGSVGMGRKHPQSRVSRTVGRCASADEAWGAGGGGGTDRCLSEGRPAASKAPTEPATLPCGVCPRGSPEPGHAARCRGRSERRLGARPGPGRLLSVWAAGLAASSAWGGRCCSRGDTGRSRPLLAPGQAASPPGGPAS